MSKISIKPAWIGAGVLLSAMAVVVKMALAVAAFNPSDAPIGYVAQDEMTNYDLKSNTQILFRGQYEREFWSGGLLNYPVSSMGVIGTENRWWNAAEEMDMQNFDTGRRIATMRDDGLAVAFRLANLSAAQQASLNSGSTALVNFLRGDQSAEGSTFRNRMHTLGDIIHSRPNFVADADNPTVFVGANDGMLHAINAGTGAGGGQERWAYIPSMLIPKLKNLAVIPYVHDYFVDGQINIGFVDSGNRRVLIGGLGAGGKGLYALDVSGSAGLTATSEAAVASKLMWEIAPTTLNYASPVTPNAFVNLGYTYGTPTIATIRTSAADATPIDVVIVGNGYNDGIGNFASCTHATPSYLNCGGTYAAYLYVIDAATGQLIKTIKAGASGTSLAPNGLSTPVAIDTNGDGMRDKAYAGDLNGTMWKFDLDAGTATALLVTSPAQAITANPSVAIHPEGGYMVNFATGKMLVAADTTDTSIFYAYGIWDGAPAANSALLPQTIDERCYAACSSTSPVRARRATTSNQPVWTSGALNHKGWRVALPAAGEKVVGEGSFIENGRFYFTSSNPTISTTIAGTSGSIPVKGENWLMELNYLNGGASSENRTFLDLNGDVVLDDKDRLKYITGDPLPTTTPATAIGDPILTTAGVAVGKYISIGLLSQPILVQALTLNETLFNQNPDVTIPPVILGQGVANGHFDQDIYFGSGAATKAAGSVKFTYSTNNRTAANVTNLVIVANGETIYSGAPGNLKPRDLDDFLDGKSSARYVITKDFNDPSTIKIEAKTAGSAFNGSISVTIATSVLSGTAAYEKFDISGGSEGTPGDRCTICRAENHIHQYDDLYDRTGVNFLNSSNSAQNLSNAIPSLSTQFKIIAHNQYLSPAVKLHVGNPAYDPLIDFGYVRVKDFLTSATLDVAVLPTYVRDSAASAPLKPIGSFAINMPVDALSAKDWWGTGDIRVGLHPTIYYCAYSSAGANDGNMYRPITPPTNGEDGPGVQGWSAGTTPATATGARHNGALTFQVIAANTPNSALEQNILGRPEYGWRVKSALFSTYVLAEYNTYWHHPNGKCYGDAGWSKNPGPDSGFSAAGQRAPGSTDPKIGELGAGAGTIVSTTATVDGNVTTTVITYSSGLTARIVRTVAADGKSVTIVTTDTEGKVTTQVAANSAGAVKSGGNERGQQAKTGRISWRELVAP